MTALPEFYAWLNDGRVLPRMVAEALKLYGTAEIKGSAHNPTIIGWAKEVGDDVAAVYKADEIAWCGLFMAVVAKRAGKIPPDHPLWALNWSMFGRLLTADEYPSLGDVLTFKRHLPNGGTAGHVGLYIAHDRECFHVLGGNQGDKVSFTRIARARLNTVRRPIYQIQPASVTPNFIAANGAISTNEA